MSIECVDATRLKDSLQCLRLYYWSHERHRVPVAPRIPLIYGSMVHACLAAHYEGKTIGECLAAAEQVWDSEMLDAGTGQSLLGEYNEEDPKRNPKRWLETFMVYRQHYRVEPFSVVGKPESPFFLQVTDDLAFVGVLDLVIKYLNQIMVMDHKTTYSIAQQWIETFNPNHQFSIYLLAANEIMKPDKPITTLMINGILSHATELRPEKLFSRVPTTRSLSQLQMIKEDMITWWTTVVRECRRTGNWPQNDARCNDWGGCPYKPLCTEVNANYRKLIPSTQQYRERVWDPIRELRQKGMEVTV